MNREDAKTAKAIFLKETLGAPRGFAGKGFGLGMMDIEEVGRQVVNSAVRVHRTLGPGLLESAYQKCLIHELRKRGLAVASEIPLPVHYDGEAIDVGYRLDLLVEEQVVIENKTVEHILPLHEAQLLTYLKLSEKSLGFLLNWNVKLMKQGIKRMVNQLKEEKQ